MKLKTLTLALLATTIPTTGVFAAALDRSGQSISAFLQPDNYFEAGISILDPTVEGQEAGTSQTRRNISDMGDDYYFPSAAIKVQATDKISLGLIYDQPFGADATYGLENPVFSQNRQGTQVEVKTENLTGLIGYQPTKNWNFYAGPVWQTVEADIALRGMAYKNSGYNIEIDKKEAWGWLAGAAYQIPEIALKAAITYRSEIKHNTTAHESFALGLLQAPSSTVQAVTPQSVNVDLQTGIAKNTLAFANIRWVHWDQFSVTPDALKAKSGFNLIDYADDQWSANVGLGHKFTDKWSGSALVSYDTGAGNPVTTLGPTEGYWGVGLGGQFSPTENYFVQAGARYMWLGDAKAQTGGTVVGEFKDNSALAYTLKFGYRF